MLLSQQQRQQEQLEEEELERVCAALRRNDPELTEVDTRKLPFLTDAVALKISRALMENTVVKKLTLDIRGLTLVGAAALVEFVEHSPSLRWIILVYFGFGVKETQIAVADQLLLAAGSHGAIEELACDSPCGVDAFVECLHSLKHSLKALKLPSRFTVDDESSELAQLNSVADAIGGVASLEVLSFNIRNPRIAASVLERMVNHERLKELQVDVDEEPTAAHVRGFLLQASEPLERLTVSARKRYLATVLSALHANNLVRELTIEVGDWGAGAGVYVSNLLRNNRCIQQLIVKYAHLDCLSTVVSALVGDRANLWLKKLEFVSPHWRQEDNREELQPAFWMNLINTVRAPDLALKELHLTSFPAPKEDLMTGLVEVLDNNTTLTKVDIECLPDGCAKQAINYFGMRNKYRPLLAPTDACKVPRMLGLFLQLQADEGGYSEDSVLSVICDTLVNRNDWKSIS